MVIIPTGSCCKEAGSVGTDRTIAKAHGSKRTARHRVLAWWAQCHCGCVCVKGTQVKEHRPAQGGDSDSWPPRLPLGQQLGGGQKEGGNWLFTVYVFPAPWILKTMHE